MTKFTRGDGLLENFLTKKRAEIAKRLISNTQRNKILDVGCGYYPYFLLNSGFKEKYGVDSSINLKRIKGKNLFLQKINVEKGKLPFRNNFFDVVTMLAVFEHINNKKINFILREIRRVLKKRGIFIITTPAPWADWLIHFMSKIYLISNEEASDHKHNHDNQKINFFLKKAGFKKENIKAGFFEAYLNMWFLAKKQNTRSTIIEQNENNKPNFTEKG